MTPVLVAFKWLVEGEEGEGFSTSCLSGWSRGRQAKRLRGQAPPQALRLYSNVDLDTDGCEVPLLHSPSQLFSPFVSLPLPLPPSIPPPLCLLSPSALLLPPHRSSFSHPSEVVA